MLVLFSAALQIACDRLAAPGVAAAVDDCKALLFPACRCVLTAKCLVPLSAFHQLGHSSPPPAAHCLAEFELWISTRYAFHIPSGHSSTVL
ncbi:hypothetical protein Q7C36_017510 [Tachysurus vachellii]|uniref:Secreted protein n=1 Tax=Tachysurus vachellii TaxID=175792 RepID=A0AA88M4M0_TACVA|nr:hypothetical protein Q7C36_017510 [Tachysurus vachellii]